eukprot:363631-Chlamydomonas_euryale.AAC.13
MGRTMGRVCSRARGSEMCPLRHLSGHTNTPGIRQNICDGRRQGTCNALRAPAGFGTHPSAAIPRARQSRPASRTEPLSLGCFDRDNNLCRKNLVRRRLQRGRPVRLRRRLFAAAVETDRPAPAVPSVAPRPPQHAPPTPRRAARRRSLPLHDGA